MVRPLLLLVFLFALASCQSSLPVKQGPATQPSSMARASVTIYLALVSGSPTHPYIEARKDAPADAVLAFTAHHVPTGAKIEGETRVIRDSSRVWEKNSMLAGLSTMGGKKSYFGDRVGVAVTLTCSVSTTGPTNLTDQETVTVPFRKNRKGTAGAFKYDAVWRSTANKAPEPTPGSVMPRASSR